MTPSSIPVIDLFAGPGGLAEGFSAVRDENGNRIFDIRVSIEKDPIAHKTLTLRALYRALKDNGDVPDEYYQYIRGEIDWSDFSSNQKIESILKEAQKEAHCLELGNDPEGKVDSLIRNALADHKDWVLIGGPPCQAYSLAGRSRRREDPSFKDDPKHFLYREYLRIIREFQPSVFVMENVKGMLSSKHDGDGIFEKIFSDLSEPAPGVEYDIRSFVVPQREARLKPNEFTIHSEDYNIPQMRHRVILLGIRADRAHLPHEALTKGIEKVTVRSVLTGLPSVRSKLSKDDTVEAWLAALEETKKNLDNWDSADKKELKSLISTAAHRARRLKSAGNSFVAKDLHLSIRLPVQLSEWLYDEKIGGVCQHQARSHMKSDLQRYLFAACFAKKYRFPAKLSQFPKPLLPNHKNVNNESVPFEDRFRVQLYNLPSTTVVSHISKDGHYYIHPDPSQCRSLTVREAARLQTFPDNYYFEGNRTEQYHQVGNAVPPYLAKQLGESVAKFLSQKK